MGQNNSNSEKLSSGYKKPIARPRTAVPVNSLGNTLNTTRSGAASTSNVSFSSGGSVPGGSTSIGLQPRTSNINQTSAATSSNPSRSGFAPLFPERSTLRNLQPQTSTNINRSIPTTTTASSAATRSGFTPLVPERSTLRNLQPQTSTNINRSVPTSSAATISGLTPLVPERSTIRNSQPQTSTNINRSVPTTNTSIAATSSGNTPLVLGRSTLMDSQPQSSTSTNRNVATSSTACSEIINSRSSYFESNTNRNTTSSAMEVEDTTLNQNRPPVYSKSQIMDLNLATMSNQQNTSQFNQTTFAQQTNQYPPPLLGINPFASINTFSQQVPVMSRHNEPNQPNMSARYIDENLQRGYNRRGNSESSRGFANRGGQNNRFNRGRGRNAYNVNRGPRGSLSNASSMESLTRDSGNQQWNNRGCGQNRQNPNRPQGPRFFGFKKLEELLTKNSEEALVIFVNNMDSVLNYLNNNEITPDVIVLLFEVLACVIKSTFIENVAQLLLAIRNNDFFTTAKKFIMELPLADSTQKNKGRRFWNACDQFFLNVALTLDAMIEVLPQTAVDIVPELLKAIIYTMPNIENEHRMTFSDEVCDAYDDVQMKMTQLIEKGEKEAKRKERVAMEGEEEEPPNDFHEIDVYPTALEITTRTQAFLRKNVIKGAYNSVYHYLDVQYRLLREDFVAPLRDGICEYFEAVNDKQKKRLSNIKIYNDVRCLGVVPNDKQVGYWVQVYKPKQKNMRNLENTRRFMYGSLVCLTPDNFMTIIFGKIIDRDKKYLVEGQLVLGFDVGVELSVSVSYLMVECTIFFEPYYQVLTALKRMRETAFPFKEYLVDVRTEPELPGYMVEGTHVDVEAKRSILNPSQLAAYRAAMMSKFCIIQGPPGTGKTYLALKVAHELLERKEVWKKQAPMLVICYTNHALDQFLEGILPKTKNIVRVGGQSKSVNMQQLNLRNLKVKNVPRDYFDRVRHSQDEVRICSKELSRYASRLKAINDFASILRFEDLIKAQTDPELDGSWFDVAEDVDILEWLLVQPDNRNQVKFEDYATITERINRLRMQENQNNAEVEEENYEQDNPLDGQRKQNQLDIDLDEDLAVKYISDDGLYNVRKEYEAIEQLAKILREMQASGLENDVRYLVTMRKVIKMHINYDYVCLQLKMLERQTMDAPVYVNHANPYTMPPNDRWLLYGNWLRRYKAVLQGEYVRADLQYRNLYTNFSEVKDMLDLFKLKQVDVVGMTTTGAARLHKTLQGLGCPIVIVEEAAEVLEAHIITALSPSCQHLILIGDHKQLKPSTADFKITRDYNLGVSLFERMVGNGLHCHMLDVQHRMRPEIANLVCPAIYPVLHNHESVLLYPNVRGVDAPLYFINHEHREKESQDRSKENQFEAEYLILLARYLALNNYDASKITIIAAYSGQWFVLLALKKKYQILRDMRICILDNFQGEENDIILLSLVRNNDEGTVGFLKLENRICVALSRAKIGMYIMGNMDQLCAADKKIWPQVKGVLEKYDAIGSYLTVRCENHKENVTHLREIQDFNQVPEGGCLKICAKPLACGHTCSKLCHSTSHDDYKCNQQCSRILCEFGHQCPDRCYMQCSLCKVPKFATLPCGHSKNIFCHESPEEAKCDEMVPTTLPCGHQTDKPCHCDPEKFRCPYQCEARVEPCGHACCRTCHVRNDPNHENYKCLKRCAQSNRKCQMPNDFKHPCQKMCFEKCDLCEVDVKKHRSCEHVYNVPCHSDVESVDCKRPCKKILECGHKCQRNCNEMCGLCKIKVTKVILECGHNIIKWVCGLEPRKKDCTNKTCSNVLPCGHPCPLKCAQDCNTAKCTALVTSSLTSPCKHTLTVPCHMRAETTLSNELLAYCKAKCSTTLSCGHPCPGTCGGCAQGRFHAVCAEKCDRTLICGHGCATPCVENCKPCIRPCGYCCEHSKCMKLCGAPCTKCTEDCGRSCDHQVCRKKCGDICEVPPCEEPCPIVLKCGHPCIGFCGDVCPPLCRVCDEEEVTDFFFGTEDEEDARFVYLTDCKHTMESSGLDRWFQTADEDENVAQVKALSCPKCKASVQALRYRDHIKKAHIDIQRIKSKYFGDPRERKELTIALKKDIEGVKAVYNQSTCREVITYLVNRIKITQNTKRQENSKAALIALRARLELFMELAKLRYNTQTPGTAPIINEKAKQLADEYLLFLFRKLTAADVSMNEPQIEEFQTEIMRFNRIMQLGQAFNYRPQLESMKEYTPCYEHIFTFTKYSKTQDNLVHVLMQALHKAAGTTLAISESERKQIVAAINLSPGHWFKCANGHIYAIGECGGAEQEATCPECGLKIGGRNHTLTSDNRLASEMDGARAPAYPTMNNIGMYRL